MSNDYKTQLDDACDRLRIMIRNERQVIDHRDAWRRMASTSSIKRNIHRRLNDEAKTLQVTLYSNR